MPHVLCLGGGYVAINLARVLRSRLRAGRVRLTVVSNENFQCFHGLVPEMLTGTLQPTDMLSPARRLFAPGDFINAEVQSIDLDGRRVTVARQLDGRTLELTYDHLVLSLGMTEHLGRFPGLAEHALRLKSYAACFAARNQFVEMLELADMEPDPVERRRLLTFVVVGGSFAGCEVAGELSEFLPLVARAHFPNIEIREIRIVLVAATPKLLPELGSREPWTSQYVESAFARDPLIEVRLHTKLASASSEEAILSDGTRIPTRTVVSCAGMSAVPVIAGLEVPRDAQQRIITDQFARVDGRTNVWAGGDCAAVPLAGGGTAPGLAIWAMTVGQLIGRNIGRTLDQARLAPYRFTGLGDACAVGHRRAIAKLNGVPIRLTGTAAWLVWRAFMLLYLPLWEKKCRVLYSWLMTAIVGRDFLNLRADAPMNVTRVFFDAGQDIVREGDVGTSLFLIQEGEVEVIKRGEGGTETQVATLGPGQQFGEVAVFQRVRRTATVRATTSARLVQIRREAATLIAGASDALHASLSRRLHSAPETETPPPRS
ncbi:MAG: FAD-dependent oxidoreductase [Gemmatimonadetes bacterium]|nr:FAD-dependent oxidoreductase [Gemmatimonadota bacterium]